MDVPHTKSPRLKSWTPHIQRVAWTGKPIIMPPAWRRSRKLTRRCAFRELAATTRAAQVHQRLPVPAGRHESAHDPHLARRSACRLASRPHVRHRGAGGRGGAWGVRHRKASNIVARRRWARCGLFARACEFKAMVDAVRTAEKALGRVSYEVTEKEKASIFPPLTVRGGRHEGR